jgi:hypothetical protein
MKPKKKPVRGAKVTKLAGSKKVTTPKINLRDLIFQQLIKNDSTNNKKYTVDEFSDKSGSCINISDDISEFSIDFGFNFEGTEATNINVYKKVICIDEVKVL